MDQNQMPANANSKVDVALNVFAKPFQTALSLLSLIRHSGERINRIWFQFEPVGSIHDKVSSYYIVDYIHKVLGIQCIASQPDIWIDLEKADETKFEDVKYRTAIRYQYAIENSKNSKLFIMHNDVVILRDIIGDLDKQIGDSFAIGQLGQCWNCPASNAELVKEIMHTPACTPETYASFRPTFTQLKELYRRAREKNIFVRPYDEGFTGFFDNAPWPLPECRINEWACLLNLDKIRPFHPPFGQDFPFGAFKQCGPINLDTAVAWFKNMHEHGFKARHFNLHGYIKHWVGTGNNTARKYMINENNAFSILKRNYKDYLVWLGEKSGNDFLN